MIWKRSFFADSDLKGRSQQTSLTGTNSWELGEDLPARSLIVRSSVDLLCSALQSNLVLCTLGLLMIGAGVLLAFIARNPDWIARVPTVVSESSEPPQRVGVPLTAQEFIAAGIPSLPADQIILEAESEPEESPGATGNFFVRVASFRNPANAERLVNALKQDTDQVREELFPKGLHVVVVGPFKNREGAELTAQLVEEKSGLSPQVVERN